VFRLKKSWPLDDDRPLRDHPALTESPTRTAAAGFIFLTIFLDVLGIGIIIPILPGIVTEFVGGDESAAARWYGPLAAVYATMQFLFAPAIGALSDRLGRRPVLLVSMAGFGLSYLLLWWAPTLGWLFLARVVSGITGATITTANAYLADVSTPQNRAQNFGLVGAAFGLGFVFGPALGGVLGSVDPRMPFLASAVLVGVNLLYGYFVLPESLPPEKRRAFALKDANPLGSLGRLRQWPLVAGLTTAFVFSTLAQRGLETVWVLYTSWRYGWEELQNGLTLALVGITVAIVQGGLIRKVVPKLGETRVIVGGLVIVALGFVGYGAAPTGMVLLMIIPLASFGSMATPTMQGLLAGAVPEDEQGAVQGALTSLLSLTAIVAPLISTGLFAYFTGPNAPFVVPGAPFFLGAVCQVLALGVAWRTLRRHGGGA
jgi:MFS transporter, DHA1 family, tetracycline resistance protein